MALIFIGSMTCTFILHKYNRINKIEQLEIMEKEKEKETVISPEIMQDNIIPYVFDPLFYVTVLFKTRTLIMYKFIKNTSEALVLFDLEQGEILSFRSQFNMIEQNDFCSTILYELSIKHPNFETFYYNVNNLCPLSQYMKYKGEIIYYGLTYFHTFTI